jgi:dsRNA-specific ribonuclease
MKNEVISEMNIDNKNGVYLGSRGEDFKNLIASLLKRGNLKKKYFNVLLSDENMKKYGNAFTTDLVDENNNYQVYEQLGDVTGNKFIVWYMYRRFPQLECTQGVKVVARLRINYGAKNSFSKIAGELGFWKYISAPIDLRQHKMKDLLEDVFEAFLGLTEKILDEYRIGVGCAIVYDILKNIFDDMDISLIYEDLYDAKTRLKELFDAYPGLGPLKYKESVTEDRITTSNVYKVEGCKFDIMANGLPHPTKYKGGRDVFLAKGSSSLKAGAQQVAALEALKVLDKQGYTKLIPEFYKIINKNNNESTHNPTKEYILKLCNNNINELFASRGKTKYYNKYKSTVLAMYCRQRCLTGIKICLELKADINILDSANMSILDLLFLNEKNEPLLKDILTLILKMVRETGIEKTKIVLNKDIYDTYYVLYSDQTFQELKKILEIK